MLRLACPGPQRRTRRRSQSSGRRRAVLRGAWAYSHAVLCMLRRAEGDAGAPAAVGRRRAVRPETRAFRRAFLAAAAAAAGAPRQELLADGDQRTAAWLALRETRLTASAFGNALGCGCTTLAGTSSAALHVTPDAALGMPDSLRALLSEHSHHVRNCSTLVHP